MPSFDGGAEEFLQSFPPASERGTKVARPANRQIPTINAMGRYVSKLEARGEKWISRGKPTRAGYRPIRIARPEDES